MNASEKSSAFAVLGNEWMDGPSPAPRHGVKQVISARLVNAQAEDPVTLARVLAEIATDSRQHIHNAAGSILSPVQEGMYDRLGGLVMTDKGGIRMGQKVSDNVLRIALLQPNEREAKKVRSNLVDALGGEIDGVRSWDILQHRYARHYQQLMYPIEPKSEERQPVKRATQAETKRFRREKVGNMVSGQMIECRNTPEDAAELLEWMQEALTSIGVTVLSVTANDFALQEKNVFDCMAVVMESHLSIRICVPENGKPFAYVSFFTCGDSKDPRPALDLIAAKLQPKFNAVTSFHRGPSGMAVNTEYFKNSRDVAALPPNIAANLASVEIQLTDIPKKRMEVVHPFDPTPSISAVSA